MQCASKKFIEIHPYCHPYEAHSKDVLSLTKYLVGIFNDVDIHTY